MKLMLHEVNIDSKPIDLLENGNLVHLIAKSKIKNLGLEISDQEAKEILMINEVSSVNEFIEKKLEETRYLEGKKDYSLCYRY